MLSSSEDVLGPFMWSLLNLLQSVQAANSHKLQFRQLGYQKPGVYSQHLIKLSNLVVLVVLICLWQKKVGNNYIISYGTQIVTDLEIRTRPRGEFF